MTGYIVFLCLGGFLGWMVSEAITMRKEASEAREERERMRRARRLMDSEPYPYRTPKAAARVLDFP